VAVRAFWRDPTSPFVTRPGMTRTQIELVTAACWRNDAHRAPHSPSHNSFLLRRYRIRDYRFMRWLHPFAYHPLVVKRWHKLHPNLAQPLFHELLDICTFVLHCDYVKRGNGFMRLRGQKSAIISFRRFMWRKFGSNRKFFQREEQFTTATNWFTWGYGDYVKMRDYKQSYCARAYRRCSKSPLAPRGARFADLDRQHYRLLNRDVHSSICQAHLLQRFADGLPRLDEFSFDCEIKWRAMYREARCDLPTFAAALVAQAAGRKPPSARSVARAIYGVR